MPTLTLAVRKRTGMALVAGFVRSLASVSWPSMLGIITSRRMASGCSRTATSMPSGPEAAQSTSHPAPETRLSAAISRISS